MAAFYQTEATTTVVIDLAVKPDVIISAARHASRRVQHRTALQCRRQIILL